MKAAKVISDILKEVSELAKVGTNLLEIEEKGEKIISKHKAKPFNKGYKPHFTDKEYQHCFCLSVNDELNHAPPKDYLLADGDLLSIDTGIIYDGEVGDAALTVGVGKVLSRDLELLKHSKNALYLGIDEIRAGVPISVVGVAISRYLNLYGYAVNESLNGHNIKDGEMHGGIQIPMFDVTSLLLKDKQIPLFEEGQIVTIEPHVTYRDRRGFLDTDGWTVRTRDEENGAVFEHMVKVLKDGYEILTDHITLK